METISVLLNLPLQNVSFDFVQLKSKPFSLSLPFEFESPSHSFDFIIPSFQSFYKNSFSSSLFVFLCGDSASLYVCPFNKMPLFFSMILFLESDAMTLRLKCTLLTFLDSIGTLPQAEVDSSSTRAVRNIHSSIEHPSR